MVACSKHCEAFVMAMRTWSWKVGNFSRNESSYEKAITAATPGFYLEWEHQKNIEGLLFNHVFINAWNYIFYCRNV